VHQVFISLMLLKQYSFYATTITTIIIIATTIISYYIINFGLDFEINKGLRSYFSAKIIFVFSFTRS